MTTSHLAKTVEFRQPRRGYRRIALLAVTLCVLSVGVLWAYASLYASEPIADPAESKAARRLRVAALSSAEKEELAREQERFKALSPEEQERLRKLHADLMADPNGPQLMAVAQRYHEWLKTLSTGQRAELLDLPADERIERIARLRRLEESRQFNHLIDAELPQEDVDLIFASVTRFIQENEPRIIASMPQHQQDMLDRVGNKEFRTRMLFFIMLRHGPQENMPMPDPDSVERLIASLTPQTRQRLESVEDSEQQAELLRRWIWAAVISRTSPEQATDEELEKFFAELPQSQRERLESLPSEQMQHELRRLYYQEKHGFRHNWRDHRRGSGREGPGRDGPGREGPGPDWGGPPPEPGEGRPQQERRRGDGDRAGEPRRPRGEGPPRSPEQNPSLRVPSTQGPPAPPSETAPAAAAPS